MRKFLAGSLAAALMATGAMAADDFSIPGYGPTSSNWDGFYGGIYGGYFNGPAAGVIGGDAGFNFELSDGIVGGVEVQAGYYPSGGWYDALVFGRLGVLADDDLLVYGMAGGGSGANAPVYAFGGGVEVMAANNFSIAGEVQAVGVVNGAFPYWRGVGKLNYHFD